jgi:hypothetical protein
MPFVFVITYRTNQPLTKKKPGQLYLGIKVTAYDTHHPQYVELYLSAPPTRLHGVMLQQNISFVF